MAAGAASSWLRRILHWRASFCADASARSASTAPAVVDMSPIARAQHRPSQRPVREDPQARVVHCGASAGALSPSRCRASRARPRRASSNCTEFGHGLVQALRVTTPFDRYCWRPGPGAHAAVEHPLSGLNGVCDPVRIPHRAQVVARPRELSVRRRRSMRQAGRGAARAPSPSALSSAAAAPPLSLVGIRTSKAAPPSRRLRDTTISSPSTSIRTCDPRRQAAGPSIGRQARSSRPTVENRAGDFVRVRAPQASRGCERIRLQTLDMEFPSCHEERYRPSGNSGPRAGGRASSATPGGKVRSRNTIRSAAPVPSMGCHRAQRRRCPDVGRMRAHLDSCAPLVGHAVHPASISTLKLGFGVGPSDGDCRTA